ncbi:MAG: 50S ribosomal protein L25 [Syntrophorhabdales bacterium]|jgi:large subunit ribosomal protein L25
MEEIRIKAEARKGRGKGPARQMRREGTIPAVLYGKDVEPLALAISSRDWWLLETHARSNAVIKMEVTDGTKVQERPVMVKNVQKRPVDDKVLHVDFLQVSMERAVQVEVPIHLVGNPVGVVNGGVVDQHLRVAMIESLPGQIPEFIEVDISNLDIGDSIHIHEISLPGVKLLDAPDVAVVGVTPPEAEEKVEVAAPAAEEAAEPTAAKEE